MSSIAFHWPDEVLRVSGSERALMGVFVGNLVTAHPALPMNKYVFDDDTKAAWSRIMQCEDARIDPRTWLSANMHDEGMFVPVLNTALAMASRVCKLLVRIHGSCEVHAYVEPSDAHFIAMLIQIAVQQRFLRPDPWGYDGWNAVARKMYTSVAPVVMSYSVCESFPSEGESFEEGLARVRAIPGLALRQAGWDDFRYTPGDSLDAMFERAVAAVMKNKVVKS